MSSSRRYSKHGHGSSGDRRERHRSSKHSGSSSGSDSSLQLVSIPWTQQETEALTEVAESLAQQLEEQEENEEERLPHGDAKELLHFLQQFLKQERLDRQDPLLNKIAYYFNQLQCVNLAKIASTMMENRIAGEELVDQDVILLLGGSRSGKTTTLHALAGTTFKEVEVDGFIHLKPTQFLDASVAGYDTSSSRTTATKKLQTCRVQMHDKDYLICDTPGFGGFESLEDEISHGLGMVVALNHAKTIRPVFVFSQECLGNRLSGFPQLFRMMAKMFAIDPTGDTVPFQYVFTRFEERHRSRLCKMFKYLTETVSNYKEDQQEIFLKVVDDIVNKTTPDANIVSPVTDIPRFLLRTLLENKDLVGEPQDWIRPFASDEALVALHTQLKLALHGILMYLASADYDRAVERMKQLQALQEVMPDAQEYATNARNACLKHAIMLYESFNERIEKKDFGSAMARVSASMKLGEVLPDADDAFMLTPESFWERFTFFATHENYIMSAESVKQLRRMTKENPDLQGEFKRGIRMIRNNIQKKLDQGEDLAKGAGLLTQLVMLAQGFPDAADFSADLLEKFEKQLMRIIHKKDFKAATAQMVGLGNLALEFPEQAHFAHYGVKMYKHALERALEKKFYDHSAELLVYIVELEPYYKSAEKYLKKGLEKLWKHFSDAIKQREYCTSVCIVKHMSKLAHTSPLAYEKTRLGIEVIRDRLFKSIENKNYNMAQVLMQQLTKLERMLPKSAPISQKDELDKKQGRLFHEPSSSRSSKPSTDAIRAPREKRSPSPARRNTHRSSPKTWSPVVKPPQERDIPSPLVRRQQQREEYTPRKTHKNYYNDGDDANDAPRMPSRAHGTPTTNAMSMEDETVSQITMDTRDFKAARDRYYQKHPPQPSSSRRANSHSHSHSSSGRSTSSRYSEELSVTQSRRGSSYKKKPTSYEESRSSRSKSKSRSTGKKSPAHQSIIRRKSSYEERAERELLTGVNSMISEKTSFSFE